MTDTFAAWDARETNRPGKPVMMLDPPEVLDGPEKILADTERAAGIKLSPYQRQQAIESIRATGTFDPADLPEENPAAKVFAAWDAQHPVLPAAKPKAAAGPDVLGYIAGDGSMENPYVAGSPDTMDLLMKTKPKDAWVRTPNGDVTQRDTTMLEDTMGAMNRAVASVRHTLETLGPNEALSEAKKTINSEKEGGYWAGNARTGYEWKPYVAGSAEAAREDFKKADRELAGAARRQEERGRETPKSISLQQQEQDLAKAKTYGQGLEAFITRPGATATQAAEMIGTFAPSSLLATAAPEAGIPAFTAQISADTYTQGIDRYLAAHNVDPSDPAARAKFWDEHPEAIDEAITSRDLHAAVAAGASLAGPLAGKGIAKVLSKGTPLASAAKQFAANAVVQPGIFVAGQEAANTALGEESSVSENLSTAVLPLAQMVHSTRAGYKARIKADAVRAKQDTAAIYRKTLEDAALTDAKAKQEALKEAIIKAQDNATSPEAKAKLRENGWNQAEQDNPLYSAEQKAAEEEAGFQTIEREREVAGQTRLDKYPDGMERVPIKPRAEVTPEEVQAEWESRKEAEDARLERVDTGRLTERIRARQQAAEAKATAKAEQDAAAKTKAEASARGLKERQETAIIDQIVAENPGKTPEELHALANARIAEAEKASKPVEPPTTTATTRTKADRDKEQAEGRAKLPYGDAHDKEYEVTDSPFSNDGSPLKVKITVNGVNGGALAHYGNGEFLDITHGLKRGLTPEEAIAESFGGHEEGTSPDTTKVTKATTKPEGVPVMITAGMKEHLKNKGYTPEEIAKLTPQAAHDILSVKGKKEPAPTEPKSKEDQEIEDYAKKLGLPPADSLDMAADKEPEAGTHEHFVKALHGVVKDLVHQNTDKTNSILEVMKQGKLIVAPNAKAVGRSDTGAAAYDIKTGKMYMYTDHLPAKGSVGAAIVAVHEGGHGGQFNDREGRPSVLRHIMGNKYGQAHEAILKAAAKGNKLAKYAVDRATSAAHEKSKALAEAGASANLQDSMRDRVTEIELVPSFLEAVEKEHGKGLGRLRGVVHDAIAGGRDLVRKAGLDLPVNLSDIIAASKKVPGEIAKTDLKGRPNSTILSADMVGSNQGASFQKAREAGKTWFGPDGRERYEIDDSQAKTNVTDTARASLQAGKKIPVSAVWEHPELEKEYPGKLDNVQLKLDASLPRNQAFYNGNTVSIHPSLLDSKHLGEILAHEVGHNIQAEEGLIRGTGPEAFLVKEQAKSRRAVEDAERTFEIVEARFPLGSAINLLPERMQETFNKRYGNLNRNEKVAHFVTDGFAENVTKTSPTAGRLVDDVKANAKAYREATDAMHQAQNAHTKLQEEAWDMYRKHYGEAEQHNVAERYNLTPEQRDKMSFTSTLNDGKGGAPEDMSRFMGRNGVARSEEKSNAFGEPPRPTKDNAEFEVYDTQTKKGVAYAHSRSSAMRMADFRDNKYGGYRYGVRKNPNKASESLDMADSSDEVKRKVPAWVHGLFDSAQGSGKVAREIVEAAVASPAGQRMISEGLVGKYRLALAKEAAERGMEPQELSKEISDKLDKVDRKTDGYSANIKAFNEVASQYGEAGEHLMALRKQADDLSIQILKSRAEQGTPLNPEEVKTYTTIRNNLGRYAHRQYAIHLGESGKHYAEDIMKDYAAYKKKNGEVSPNVKANYEKVERVVRKLIDEQLVIPSDEALAALPTEQIDSIFETWSSVTDPTAYTREQKLDRLAKIRDAVNSNGDEMRRTAEDIVKQILELKDATSPVVKYYRGGKLDKGILKQRANISPELRELMGEIKDPAMRMFVTVAKQAEFVARNRMLTELRDMNEPEHVQPPGNPGRKEVQGMIKLSDSAFGPLQNHYVSKNLHNLLSDHVQQLANFEQAVAMAVSRNDVLAQLAATKAIRAWGKVAGTAKMMQIIYNPANFMYNFLGGPRTLLVHGNVNPKYMWEAAKTARDIVHYSINPTSNSARARRAAAAGITDSAFNGEIRGELLQELNKTLRDMKGADSSKLVKALRKGRDYVVKGKTVTNETYAMMDVTYKIANFLQMADHLKAFYEAEGISKTPEQIDREAADITNRTNVTYKRAAPMVRALEKYGATNFGTFFYEVFRSEVNNLRQGFDELRRANTAKTKEGASLMRVQGAKRLLGQLTAWGLTLAATRALGVLAFGDDKEKEKKLRAMLPDYEQTKDFVPIGKDENGKPILFDVARFDPAGPLTDIARAAMNGDMDIDQLESQVFQLYVAPRIGKQLVAAVGTSTGLNDKKPADPAMEQLFPNAFGEALKATKAAGFENRTTKAWTNVAEQFLPGVVKSWRKSAARPMVEESPVAWAMTYGGASMYKANPESLAKDASVAYDATTKTGRKVVTELFHDNPNMTQDELTGHLQDIRQEEEDKFNDLKKVYEGMQALDMSEREIRRTLKGADVPQAVIHDLRHGEFNSHAVSKKSIEQFRQRELSKPNLTDEQKTQIKQKWKDIWAMLRASEDELNEEDN